MPEWLGEAGIEYHHLQELTGRRRKQPEIPQELNAGWQNRSFKNYADYTLTARGWTVRHLSTTAEPRLHELGMWGAHAEVSDDGAASCTGEKEDEHATGELARDRRSGGGRGLRRHGPELGL